MKSLFNATNNKKGQVMSQLGSLGVGIAGLAITLVITFLIISQGRTQVVDVEGVNVSDTSTWTTSYNATQELGSAVDSIPSWVPIIVITFIGAILLGLVRMFKS